MGIQHLSLRSIHLGPHGEWADQSQRRGNWGTLSFVLPKEGQGVWSRGPARQDFRDGDILVGSASPGGQIQEATGSGLVFRHFSVSVEQLLPLVPGTELSALQDLPQRLSRPKLHPASTPVADRCRRLLEELPDEPHVEHRCRLVAVAGAVLQADFQDRNSGGSGARNPEQMAQALSRLSVAELSRLPVADLARRFGCGRRQLNRLFQRYFGLSVADMKMEMRLVNAAALLRDPHAKVTTVAEFCGFNHVGLFNAQFKRRFGVSPGQFRKSVITAADPQDATMRCLADCWMRAQNLCPWPGPGS